MQTKSAQIIDASNHLTYELCFYYFLLCMNEETEGHRDTQQASCQDRNSRSLTQGCQSIWPFLLIFLPLNASELKTISKQVSRIIKLSTLQSMRKGSETLCLDRLARRSGLTVAEFVAFDSSSGLVFPSTMDK